MVPAEEDGGHQAVVATRGSDGVDPGEEIAMMESSTGGASKKPVQNVQKNPEKDPAETTDQGTLQEQKQDQHKDEQE